MKIRLLTRQGIKEIEGKVITYKNIDFGIPFKNTNPEHEFTHIASGNGFNGNGKRNLDSLKSMEKKQGVKKFWEVIKLQKTIEDGLKVNKERDIHNNTFDLRVKVLNNETGLRLKRDVMMSMVSGKLNINIFNLEDQLKNMGYNDDRMSIDDFITGKWGKETSKKIKELI